jgi:class 3 adenylate cyclase
VTDPQQVRQTIEILQAHQAILGETVVKTSLEALHQYLAAPAAPPASTANLTGERKQVTVMFADISGFTALSEKLDPEEVRSMINACFERLGAVITRYDGHIDKFIGDEIMALFGAPIAHENDPERALRAALEMVTALENFNTEFADQLLQPLALHFGINSGLVIAGDIGTRQRSDYSVMGDPVNLASRLEGLSEAGEILVGEETYRLTAPLFDFETLKPVKVKGKAQPVRIYRLLKAKIEPGQVRGIEGLSSPLVGRTEEMALLQAAVARLREGQGGIVSVIGEAGLGKSRLIKELYRHGVEAGDAGSNWAVGRAVSYGENVSYLLVRDLFRHFLGVGSGTPLSEVVDALESELDEFLPEKKADIFPFLAHLLELPLAEESAQRLRYLTGEALHREILQAVQTLVTGRSQTHPLILVWEDLHWADPSSLSVLESLLDLIERCRLLLVLIFRPRPGSRIWAFHQHVSQRLAGSYHCLELPPLNSQESEQLLKNLLRTCDLLSQTYQIILNKAEGNPFYLEEVIRSLIDRGSITRAEDGQQGVVSAGIAHVPIPNTLQGVIMARIDRLSPELKRTLQVASVIGRNFSYRVLAKVMGEE